MAGCWTWAGGAMVRGVGWEWSGTGVGGTARAQARVSGLAKFTIYYVHWLTKPKN